MGEPERATDLVSYNYAHFDEHIRDGGERDAARAFRSSFRAGEPAEDFALPRLDDAAQVRLSDLWRAKPMVMEFGSFT